MADCMYAAPVIPGPQGARSARAARDAARAAALGEPGHYEKLIDRAGAVWPLEQRAEDITWR
jgi:hypothetical protein